MDINSLFTDQGLRAFTATVRDQHVRDAQQYGQIADIVRRRLEQTPVEGDRWVWAAKKIRAWKVSRQLKAMQKASGEAASKAEALYATYVNEVLALPKRRETAAAKKLERKSGRQAAVGAAVAGSLNRTVTALNTPQEQMLGAVPQARPAEFLAPDNPWQQWPMAAGGERPTSTINDYFPQGEGR
ncbi:hypothetical protein [Streptomyces sp. NPDC056883]|uniref:hypothetical protein n=1 Tax=Streptomyces sp. NPDC056883 TaxID=3345959 RepID=UPI0036AA1CF5